MLYLGDATVQLPLQHVPLSGKQRNPFGIHVLVHFPLQRFPLFWPYGHSVGTEGVA